MPAKNADVPSRSPLPMTFRSTPRPVAALLSAALAALPLASCRSTASPAPQDATSNAAASEPARLTADDLDRVMVIGPTAARQLGYRIDWEAKEVIPAGRTIRLMQPAGDALFVLDSVNDLARVKTSDGVRIWQAPVGDPVDNVLGINRVSSPSDRIFVTVEGAMLVLDAGNGGFISRDKLSRIASTGAVEAGNFLIYGGRAGEIVWQEFRVGHPWRVNAVDGSIEHRPVLVSDGRGADIVAASTAGVVVVMDARTARTIWSKPLLANVSTRPAAGNGLAFVAGEDQYLWALRLADGSTAWKFFTDAPLTTGPVLLGDRLYQRIPSEGLVAFDAFQNDRPDGRKVWTSKDVKGEVIGRKGRNLLAWDGSSRTLSLVDDRGGVVQSVVLPQVQQLVLTAEVDGDLYANAADGRVIKLVVQ